MWENRRSADFTSNKLRKSKVMEVQEQKKVYCTYALHHRVPYVLHVTYLLHGAESFLRS